MNRLRTSFYLSICLSLMLAGFSRADITDFTNWSIVEDPPNDNLSASVTAAEAVLVAANGAVPNAADIGYKSINGPNALSSTQGYAFSPSADFSIAVDYDWVFSGNPVGFLSLGFGVGEDDNGEDSVGAVMVTSGGSPLGNFSGGARVDNMSEIKGTAVAASSSGSLFVSYDSASGDMTIGGSQSKGAAAPDTGGSATYDGIQNQWNDRDLFASFFIRSDPFTWQGGGTAEATFSNFRILNGASQAVPEPTSLTVLFLFGTGLGLRRRR